MLNRSRRPFLISIIAAMLLWALTLQIQAQEPCGPMGKEGGGGQEPAPPPPSDTTQEQMGRTFEPKPEGGAKSILEESGEVSKELKKEKQQQKGLEETFTPSQGTP